MSILSILSILSVLMAISQKLRDPPREKKKASFVSVPHVITILRRVFSQVDEISRNHQNRPAAALERLGFGLNRFFLTEILGTPVFLWEWCVLFYFVGWESSHAFFSCPRKIVGFPLDGMGSGLFLNIRCLKNSDDSTKP